MDQRRTYPIDAIPIIPGLDEDVARAYYDRLMLHISCVQKAARELGVPAEQWEVHDLSKFSRLEFEGYALHFCGGGAPHMFARAWMHHIHDNLHHWQYWIFPDGFAPTGSHSEKGVMPMPENYVLEMVADWMGASEAYSGTADMSSWLVGNLGKIHLHTTSTAYLRKVLARLGYGDIAYAILLGHELAHEDVDQGEYM